MRRNYFGTNGIRGIVGDLITPEFISKMSSAIAALIKNTGTVIIGSDPRLSGPALKKNRSYRFGCGSNSIGSICS